MRFHWLEIVFMYCCVIWCAAELIIWSGIHNMLVGCFFGFPVIIYAFFRSLHALACYLEQKWNSWWCTNDSLE